MPVLELLGLSDSESGLTISLPNGADGELAVTMHATTLTVEPDSSEDHSHVPQSIDQVDALTQEWNDLVQLSDVTTDDYVNTGALVSRLWEATEVDDELDEDWEPIPFAEEDEREPTLRWQFLAGGVALVLVAAGAAWLFGASGGPTSEDVRVRYAEATADLRSATAAAWSSIGPITDLDASGQDMSDATDHLAAFDAQARRAIALADETPPSTGLLGTEDSSMEPIRANLRTGAERAIEIERRLSEALTYRLLMDRVLVLPTLPQATSPGNIPAVGVELSLVIADSAELLSQLPGDEAFSDHRASAQALLDGLDAWQVDYLTALRNASVTETSQLVGDLQSDIEDLRGELAGPLAHIAGWAEREVAYVNASLDRIDDLLTEPAQS